MKATKTDTTQIKHPLDEVGLPCRFCGSTLDTTFVDLGMTPLCQNRIRQEDLNRYEPFYPLHAFVCRDCYLVQLGEYVAPDEIFEDYGYFSSFSDSWLKHARDYSEKMIERFGFDRESFVVELASNDGYLLQNFVERGISCLGIEPADTVAAAAREKGVPTVERFFGLETARAVRDEYRPANLLLGNNVLAHVPDLNDFVAGMKHLLADDGVITMEFPHLVQLMDQNQFDTIYHEHFSYFSFTTVNKVFAYHGITLFDVEELQSHGGSLRIYGRHTDNDSRAIEPAVDDLLTREKGWGVSSLDTYAAFDEQVRETKRSILEFLIDAKRYGKQVVGYGAPGKGNTLLNYCGIGTDFLSYTVDRSPHKQGTFTPGTHIPIFSPDKYRETQPDYILILPWNLTREITEQMAYVREWGGQFVVPIPKLKVL